MKYLKKYFYFQLESKPAAPSESDSVCGCSDKACIGADLVWFGVVGTLRWCLAVVLKYSAARFARRFLTELNFGGPIAFASLFYCNSLNWDGRKNRNWLESLRKIVKYDGRKAFTGGILSAEPHVLWMASNDDIGTLPLACSTRWFMWWPPYCKLLLFPTPKKLLNASVVFFTRTFSDPIRRKPRSFSVNKTIIQMIMCYQME